MELVVNLWPIVDSAAQLILRFAARAYAMESDDAVISRTLKNLAGTDFVLARQFRIPKCFVLKTEHGDLPGAVMAADFNIMQDTIIEEALRILETDLPVLLGVGMDPTGKPFQQRVAVSFPQTPYFVVTFLIEDAAGNLHVHSRT